MEVFNTIAANFEFYMKYNISTQEQMIDQEIA